MSGEPMERAQCTAKSKQSGERCRKSPVPGLSVCGMHGGKSPAAVVKAAENLQAAAADTEIRKLWVGLDQAVAVTDPVDSMARLAGGLEQLLDKVGEKVNEISNLAAGESMAQIRGELVLLERVAALLARLLDSMARLGIAERQVQLQADQAELISAAFRGALGAVASSLLTPGDKDLMLRAFLTGIGVDVTAMVEGGGQVPA